MNPRMKRIILALLFILVIVFFVVAFKGILQKMKQKKIIEASNQKIFQEILFSPVPSEVSDIRGLGFQEGERDTYFVFQGTEKTVQDLLQLHSYMKKECTDLSLFSSLFEPSIDPQFQSYLKKWDIQEVTSPECYTSLIFNATGIEGKLYTNTLRAKAQSEFLFDKDSNIIYFHEIGS